jgi:CheY-like chemotaxis protein
VDGALAGLRVLVVDDDRDTLELAAALLTLAGATAYRAEGVADALSMMAEHAPTVILTDLSMPEQDGYALLRQVRDLERAAGGRATPVVALSGNVYEEDRVRSRAAGFFAHLAKPASLEDIVEAVRAAASGARRAE